MERVVIEQQLAQKYFAKVGDNQDMAEGLPGAVSFYLLHQ
jgi:hypothetical protein